MGLPVAAIFGPPLVGGALWAFALARRPALFRRSVQAAAFLGGVAVFAVLLREPLGLEASAWWLVPAVLLWMTAAIADRLDATRGDGATTALASTWRDGLRRHGWDLAFAIPSVLFQAVRSVARLLMRGPPRLAARGLAALRPAPRIAKGLSVAALAAAVFLLVAALTAAILRRGDLPSGWWIFGSWWLLSFAGEVAAATPSAGDSEAATTAP
ncbi:MAG TPA: hypothetical protein VEI02_04575 [Planctomycetota bacterium]|nr:hypothetical protein [Planctomycetota bacterium]